MFLPNYSDDDECKLKPVILEFIIVVGLLLMASPLIAFADDAKNVKETPRTKITTSIAKSKNWAVSIPAQGENFP